MWASFCVEAFIEELIKDRPKYHRYIIIPMLNPDGSHSFTATYAKHLENIRAFRAYQKERQELRDKNNTTHLTAKSKV